MCELSNLMYELSNQMCELCNLSCEVSGYRTNREQRRAVDHFTKYAANGPTREGNIHTYNTLYSV